MDTIKIADIKIGDRRREDLGDIGALSESIRQYGLLAPPVLTDDGTLVAGQRRVEAMKRLGWTETPFINKGQLTAERLHEIELEENIRRKDFTEYEISKNMVALAEAVGERLIREVLSNAIPDENASISENQNERFSLTVSKNPVGGRPEKTNSKQAIADVIGVNRQTIDNARAHVAAVEAYPILEQSSKMKAISIAKQAAKLPEEERKIFVEAQATAPHGEKPRLSALTPNPLTEEQQAELDRDLAKNAHDADIARKFVNAMAAIQTLEVTMENVETWIRFERMTRDEIEDAHDDVRDCISRFQQIEEMMTGMNKLRIVR